MLRVELKSQQGFSREPGRIRVYDNDVLAIEIIATITHKQGADGRLYPCVELQQTVPESITPISVPAYIEE